MRLPRWAPWIGEVLANSPAITDVTPFEAAGITHKPCGHVVTLRTGARVYLQWVRTAATVVDDDHAKPEQGVPGAPTEVVPEVTLPTSGQIPLRLIEQHLVALIANTEHPEIAEVVAKSDVDSSTTPPGPCRVAVHFHSGASIIGLFLHTLPAGSSPGREEFRQRQEI